MLPTDFVAVHFEARPERLAYHEGLQAFARLRGGNRVDPRTGRRDGHDISVGKADDLPGIQVHLGGNVLDYSLGSVSGVLVEEVGAPEAVGLVLVAEEPSRPVVDAHPAQVRDSATAHGCC